MNKSKLLSCTLALSLSVSMMAAGFSARSEASEVLLLACEASDKGDNLTLLTDNGCIPENADNLDTEDKKAGDAALVLATKADAAPPYLDLQAANLGGSLAAGDVDKMQLEFWLYVSDVSLISSTSRGRIEIASASGDTQRIYWDLVELNIRHCLQNGWNKVKLPLASGQKDSDPLKPGQINHFRFFAFYNQEAADKSKPLVVKLDDIKLTPVTGDDSGILTDGGSYDPYLYDIHTNNAGGLASIFDSENNQTGDYCLSMSTKAGNIPAMLVCKGGLPYPLFNLGDVSNKQLELTLYINDVEYLNEARLELGSTGSENDCLRFWLSNNDTINLLESGWNTLTLPFVDSGYTERFGGEGDMDFTKINFFRIYAAGSSFTRDLVFKIDSIKVTTIAGGDDDEDGGKDDALLTSKDAAVKVETGKITLSKDMTVAQLKAALAPAEGVTLKFLTADGKEAADTASAKDVAKLQAIQDGETAAEYTVTVKTTPPPTGDIGLAVSALLLAAAGLSGALFLRKKR